MNDPLTYPEEGTAVDRAALYAARRAAENRRFLAQFDAEELDAVRGLFDVACRLWYTGGGGTAARLLLLGIYNGNRFPFDLTDLRRLDKNNLAMALTVLRMDARCRAEVHVILSALLDDMTVQSRMEVWAYDMGLKHRAKKAEAEEMRRRVYP